MLTLTLTRPQSSLLLAHSQWARQHSGSPFLLPVTPRVNLFPTWDERVKDTTRNESYTEKSSNWEACFFGLQIELAVRELTLILERWEKRKILIKCSTHHRHELNRKWQWGHTRKVKDKFKYEGAVYLNFVHHYCQESSMSDGRGVLPIAGYTGSVFCAWLYERVENFVVLMF